MWRIKVLSIRRFSKTGESARDEEMAGRPRRVEVISEATTDDYESLLRTIKPNSNVSEAMRAYEKENKIAMNYDKLARLVRNKRDKGVLSRGRPRLLSDAACQVITRLIRGGATTKGRMSKSVLRKLMRGLLAAELGLLSDDALVPRGGRSLMQGPVGGDADGQLSGDENDEEDDPDEAAISALGARGAPLELTPESVRAALDSVFRGRERLLPYELMNFPSQHTLTRYMLLYRWAARKPNIQNPHRFTGSSPVFLNIYFDAVRYLFSELRIRMLCQLLFQDEIIFCAELDKAARRLKVLVASKEVVQRGCRLCCWIFVNFAID